MGTAVELHGVVRKSDAKRFVEIFEPTMDLQPVKDGFGMDVMEVLVYNAGEEPCKKAAAEGLVFVLYHADGEDYGKGTYVGVKGKLYHAQQNMECDFVVTVSNDGVVDEDDLTELRETLEAEKLAEALIKADEVNHWRVVNTGTEGSFPAGISNRADYKEVARWIIENKESGKLAGYYLKDFIVVFVEDEEDAMVSLGWHDIQHPAMADFENEVVNAIKKIKAEEWERSEAAHREGQS